MRNGVVFAVLFALSTQAGCGGSSSSGGGSVTSVSGSKPLNTLSSADTAQICTDTNAYVNSKISNADQCKFAAVILAALSGGTTDADLRATCSDFYTSCTASGPTQSCDIGDLSTCVPSATVAELSNCVADDVTATKQIINALPSCSALTASSLSSLNISPTPSAACTKLATDCPDATPPA